MSLSLIDVGSFQYAVDALRGTCKLVHGEHRGTRGLDGGPFRRVELEGSCCIVGAGSDEDYST